MSLQEAKNKFLAAAPVGPSVRFDPAIQFLPPLQSEAKRREIALLAASSTSMISAMSGSASSEQFVGPSAVSKSPHDPFPVNAVSSTATSGVDLVQQQTLATILQLRRDVQQQTLDLYIAMGNRSRFLFRNLFSEDACNNYTGFGATKGKKEAVTVDGFDELVSEFVSSRQRSGGSSDSVSPMTIQERDMLLTGMPPPPAVDEMIADQEEYENDRLIDEQREADRRDVEDTIRHVAFQNQHRFLYDAQRQQGKGQTDKDEIPQRRQHPVTTDRPAQSSLNPLQVLMNAETTDDMHRLIEVETIDCQVMLSYIMQAAAAYHQDQHQGGEETREGSSASTPSITPIHSVNHGVSQLPSALLQGPPQQGQNPLPQSRLEGTAGAQVLAGKQQQQVKKQGPTPSASLDRKQQPPPAAAPAYDMPAPVVVAVRPTNDLLGVAALSTSNTTGSHNASSHNSRSKRNGAQHGSAGSPNKSGNTTTSSGTTTSSNKSPAPLVPGDGAGGRAGQSTTFVDLADSAAAASVLQAHHQSNSSGHDTSTQRTGQVTRASKRSSRSGSKKTSSGGLFSCFRRTDPSSSSSSSSSDEIVPGEPAAAAAAALPQGAAPLQSQQRPHWV